MSIYGRLEAFFETGTEGVVWSLHNPILPGYYGLVPLNDGDHLSVFDDSGNVIWQGVIKLEYERNYQQYPLNPSHGQQSIFGCWVHGFQSDVDPETWAAWFFDGYRAALRQIQECQPHLFELPNEVILRTILRYGDLPLYDVANLYRAARYTWIHWYGERIDAAEPYWEVSSCEGIHKEFGFSESDALRIIGARDAGQIRAWKLGENTSINHAMFFRSAMLSGITGRLRLQFTNDKQICEWLDYKTIGNDLARDCFYTLSGLRRLHNYITDHLCLQF
jgi:hypothetical protein